MNRSTAFLAVLGLVSSVSLASPIVGTYTNAEGILDGRWTESFLGGGPSQVGNLIEAASWDGAVLGNQWELTGVTLLTDTEISNNTIGNLQVIQYYTVYSGGTLTFKDGPMIALGDSDYNVSLTSFTQSTIVTLFNNIPLTVTGSISMQGVFVNQPGFALNYLAAVTGIAGSGAAAPAGYPSIGGVNGGQWGAASQVQFQIVPEPATVVVLALGGMALLRRRRT